MAVVWNTDCLGAMHIIEDGLKEMDGTKHDCRESCKTFKKAGIETRADDVHRTYSDRTHKIQDDLLQRNVVFGYPGCLGVVQPPVLIARNFEPRSVAIARWLFDR